MTIVLNILMVIAALVLIVTVLMQDSESDGKPLRILSATIYAEG